MFCDNELASWIRAGSPLDAGSPAKCTSSHLVSLWPWSVEPSSGVWGQWGGPGPALVFGGFLWMTKDYSMVFGKGEMAQ